MSSFNELKKLQSVLKKTYNSAASDEPEKAQAIILSLPYFEEFVKTLAKLTESLSPSALDKYVKVPSNLAELFTSNTRDTEIFFQPAFTDTKTKVPSSFSHDSMPKSSILDDSSHKENEGDPIVPETKIPTMSSEDSTPLDTKYIELTKDDCISINTILESSGSDNALPKAQIGKISLSGLLTLLFTIIGIFFPMAQNSYYHKSDAMEAQKAQKAEIQLKEEELRIKEEELLTAKQQFQNDIEQKEIIENILIELKTLSEYCKSLQEALEYPPQIPEPFDEVPHSLGGIQDNGLSNPDVSKNLETETCE